MLRILLHFLVYFQQVRKALSLLQFSDATPRILNLEWLDLQQNILGYVEDMENESFVSVPADTKVLNLCHILIDQVH